MHDLGINCIHVLSYILLASHALLCGAVQVARVTPSPVGHAAMKFRHDSYVDSKVRQVVANFLNHENYHHRKVVFPSPASDLPDFASNLTATTVSSLSTKSALEQLESFSSTSTYAATSLDSSKPTLQPALNPPPGDFNVNAVSSVTNTTQNSTLLNSLGSAPQSPVGSGSSYLYRHKYKGNTTVIQDLATTGNEGTSWQSSTDKACSTKLTKLDGVATNPSGISACYNVRSLDNTTGAFQADLRIYRLAPASGDWTQMRNNGFSAGIAYPDASISLESKVEKRHLVGFIGPVMHQVGEKLQARTGQNAPRLLQTLSFVGQVNNGSIPELRVEGIAFALLKPNINLAGSTNNGTSISTPLALQDASFVHGLFVDLHASSIGSPSFMATGSREWVSKGNTFSGFPVSLVLVGAWSVLMLILEGVGLGRRIECRNKDLKRMKEEENAWTET